MEKEGKGGGSEVWLQFLGAASAAMGDASCKRRKN